MAHQKSLRPATALLFAAWLLTVVVGLFHAEGGSANDHASSFTAYGSSGTWTLVHLGQFAGMVLLVAGLLALYHSLASQTRDDSLVSRFAAAASVVTLALYGVLQGVDGVALKQTAMAWLNAPAEEKAGRFASAEVVRWLEWGIRSYHGFVLGITLVLFAVVVVTVLRAPTPIGYLMGLTGLLYMAQGWIVGVEGFAPANTVPTLAAYLLWLVWSVWLLVITWRPGQSERAIGPTTGV